MTDLYHIMPVGDLIGHSADDGCVCGPTGQLMQRQSGDAWLMVHHSLDGREQREVSRAETD